MIIDPLKTDDIESFLSKHGKAGQKILAGLGEIYPELSAILSTEVGREIIKGDIQRIELLFPLVYTEKATSEQLAEYRYLRDIRMPSLLNKLMTYLTKSGLIRSKE